MSTDSLWLIEIDFSEISSGAMFSGSSVLATVFLASWEGWLLKYYGLIDRSNEISLLPLPGKSHFKISFFRKPNPH